MISTESLYEWKHITSKEDVYQLGTQSSLDLYCLKVNLRMFKRFLNY